MSDNLVSAGLRRLMRQITGLSFNETLGVGVDILTSNPILHFFSFESMFWFNLY